ncbi:Crp/Fnr family transcriptional regulator [Pacificimonas sp. WHA3]|uniref:Crp/Fnr family transcriptional regulator n=1 Tax=Pacificimonas pallii TaxID=2827236 RepID=A0ABS6SG66_9SPHN|nr:Crp/Fnr family transcriptional regulator [Pacificimonas pallii]MBV7257423.1 Crp/Fnr family transcriptional regulator [Pacificimonas pallii]
METLSVACEACPVRNKAICAALSGPELSGLRQIRRHQFIPAGQTLVWEGDDAFVVASVTAGVLKLTKSLGDGKEQIVGLAFPADFVGRPFHDKTMSTVTALTDTEVCVFRREDFDNFAREHPELEHKLLERTLAELERAREWMTRLGRKTASEKVSSFVLDISERLSAETCHGSTVLDRFELPFGRQQVADILGLTIETVSRQMTSLKRQGLIGLSGRRTIQILNREGLAKAAES